MLDPVVEMEVAGMTTRELLNGLAGASPADEGGCPVAAGLVDGRSCKRGGRSFPLRYRGNRGEGKDRP